MKKSGMLFLLALAVMGAFLVCPVSAGDLNGMISRMDGNVAVVSIPASKGIQPGMILYAYRAAKFIGRVEVSEVGTYYSKVMALPECRGLKVGDAIMTCPACEVYRPLPPYGTNVSPGFILNETDGRSLVVGRIDLPSLEKLRDAHLLGPIVLQFQNLENAEDFYMVPSRTGYLFLELPPGSYILKRIFINSLAGVQYNALGIPLGVVTGFMMKHGGTVLPAHYKFTVPEKSPMVYIGSLKFSLDPKAPFTKIYKTLPTYTSISDDYSEAMGEVARLNPFIRKIGVPADLHLEAKADKSLMELVPAGAGVLFAARGEKDQAFKEYWDCLKYREAPYRAEVHNALAGMYWDRENWEEALNHYWLAQELGYPVPADRMQCLSSLKRLSRPTIDDY